MKACFQSSRSMRGLTACSDEAPSRFLRLRETRLRKRRKRFCTVAACTTVLAASAHANSDGPPWGSADPNAAQNCNSCHFDNDAVMGSDAIELELNAGSVRSRIDSAGDGAVMLNIQFTNPVNQMAGFQIIASEGAFKKTSADVETNKVQARSSAPKNAGHSRNDEENRLNATLWNVLWVPDLSSENNFINFLVAINASNDDASAFGDEIHYKAFSVKLGDNFVKDPPEIFDDNEARLPTKDREDG